MATKVNLRKECVGGSWHLPKQAVGWQDRGLIAALRSDSSASLTQVRAPRSLAPGVDHLPMEVELCAVQLPGREGRYSESFCVDLALLMRSLSLFCSPLPT
jgi:hypothetical protein